MNELVRRRRALMAMQAAEKGLPSEYQQVEYIAHSKAKTNYINNISPYANVNKVVLDFQITTIANSSSAIVLGKNGPAFPCGETYHDSSLGVPGQRGYDCFPQTSATSIRPRTTYTFTKLENAPITDSFSLLGWANNTFCCGLRAYGAKMYNTNDKLIFDGVPCYRKSDGVIGLYDLIGRKFFSVSGTWSKGEDVT